MSHDLEYNADGSVNFAFTGDRKAIWHRLGHEVSEDMSPEEFMVASGCNWTVEKHPVTADLNGKVIETGHSALIRSTDHKVLDVVTDSWNPVQNHEVFDFFRSFVDEGDMKMSAAGSLREGRLVFATAEVQEGFTLPGGDEVKGYLLISNPHTFGRCTDIRFCMTRTVCANTLAVALGEVTDDQVRHSHRRVWDADRLKQLLLTARERAAKYREKAEYLQRHKYSNETMEEYFSRLFPVLTPKGSERKKNFSNNAERAMEIVETQPGASIAPKSMWNLFNACTYITNHEYGKTDDRRMDNLVYGANASKNQMALELAVQMAS